MGSFSGQGDNNGIQLHLTTVLALLRSSTPSTIPHFDCSTIETKFVNKLKMEGMLDFIFTKCTQSIEVEALLRVVVAVAVAVHDQDAFSSNAALSQSLSFRSLSASADCADCAACAASAASAFSASASPPPSSPRSSPQPPRQTWKINEWLANRLCEILNGLMKGDYTFMSPQSVVYYVIDAIQSLGITPGIIEQLVSLPWVASNRLVRMQVASVVSQHEQ
jgi:hypothetical protein